MSKSLGFVATLAEMQDFYNGQPAGDIIELMNETNDILDDVKFMESNESGGHKTRMRTGLPEVFWRRLYKGVPYSKSTWTQVKEPCSMMESRMLLDEAEIQLFGANASKFIYSESVSFMESMRQKAATTLFYGNSDKNPDEFMGLNMRYPSKNSPNVIDAGGTGEVTSIWFISWGDRTIHGIYPKNSKGGLQHKDLGIQTVKDDDGGDFEANVNRYQWSLGLALRDWRAVVRICNIPVAALTARKGDANFVDLQALLVRAKMKMPEAMRQKAIWYMNEEVMTALALQATDAGNIHLTYGQAFNAPDTSFLFSRPVRQCDAISSKETALK